MDGDKIQRDDLSQAENDDLTSLHAAASNGHLDVVQVLIGQGADINSAGNDGMTPLHVASFNGHLDVVQFLTDQGAELDTAGFDVRTPLCEASFNGHLDVVQFLTDQGADLNRAGKYCMTPLCAASFNGHLDVVKFLTHQGAELDKAVLGARRPLCAASFNGHLDVVKFLIHQGAKLDKPDGYRVMTPLYEASFNGHLDVVQFLIDQGADLNWAGKDCMTPLCAASFNGHLDVVKFLIHQGAELDKAGNCVRTPLCAASLNGHLDVVQFLTHQGAELDKAGSCARRPLCAASCNGHLDVVKFLTHQGAELDKGDGYNMTPLCVASFNGHLDVVQFLTDQGADLNRADKNCMTPLEAASLTGHLDVVQFLIGKGADLRREAIGGSTPPYAQFIDKDPTVCSQKEGGSVEKQLDIEANVHTSKLEQLNIDSASSEHVVEDVIRDSMGASDQQSGLIRIEKYGIEVQFHPSEIWGVDDIQAVPEVPAELADLLTEDQAIICVGLKASPSDAKYKYPVKVTMPHSAIFTSPNTASIGTYHRKSNSDSFSLLAAANGDPRCDVRERDLDLYISHFSEWWIIAFITKVFFGKRVICTPFVPVPSRRNAKHLLKLCIRDSNFGKAEPKLGYVTPEEEEEFFVAWRSGDLEVTCQVDGREIGTQTRQETLFRNLVEVNVPFVNTVTAGKSEVEVRFILKQSATIDIICLMNMLGDQVTPKANGAQSLRPTDSPEVTNVHLLRISQELLPAQFTALYVVLDIQESIAQDILAQNDHRQTYMQLLQLWKRRSHRTWADLDQVLVDLDAGGLISKYKQEPK